MRRSIQSSVVTAVAMGLVLASTVQAGDPAVKCETKKLKESGTYSKCRLKAEAKGVKKAEPADYTECEEKFGEKWEKVEGKAEGACPTNDDKTSMDARITTDAAEVATLLAGGSVESCGDDVAEGAESCDGADLGATTCENLGFASGTLACTAGCGFDVSGCVSNPAPVDCGNGVIDGGEECDFGDLDGESCTSQLGEEAVGSLACASSTCVFDTAGCQARFESQTVGGPTVVDHLTGLEWVVTNDGDGSPDAGDLLDADNTYTWSTGTNDEDGTAFTVYIAALNGGSYGGHNDWRLPSSGGTFGIGPFAPSELESILDSPCGNPCIDEALFGDTASSDYWSATTETGYPGIAWIVHFSVASVFFGNKTFEQHVRAVRGGL